MVTTWRAHPSHLWALGQVEIYWHGLLSLTRLPARTSCQGCGSVDYRDKHAVWESRLEPRAPPSSVLPPALEPRVLRRAGGWKAGPPRTRCRRSRNFLVRLSVMILPQVDVSRFVKNKLNSIKRVSLRSTAGLRRAGGFWEPWVLSVSLLCERLFIAA